MMGCWSSDRSPASDRSPGLDLEWKRHLRERIGCQKSIAAGCPSITPTSCDVGLRVVWAFFRHHNFLSSSCQSRERHLFASSSKIGKLLGFYVSCATPRGNLTEARGGGTARREISTQNKHTYAEEKFVWTIPRHEYQLSNEPRGSPSSPPSHRPQCPAASPSKS